VIKTLHLTNNWHAASGGVRTWYQSAIDAANVERRPIRLVVPGPRTFVEDVGEFGRIYHLRAVPTAPVDRRYRILLPHRYLLPAGAVRRVLESERPDVVEICDKFTLNWLAGLIRKRRLRSIGRPVVVGLTCERLDDTIGAFVTSRVSAQRLAATYCRWCYVPLFDAHLAVSDYVGRELRDAMHPLHRRPVKILTPGVDLATFSPRYRSDAVRRRYLPGDRAGERAVLMLYAGRLSPEKNVGLLVQVMDRLNAGNDGTEYCLVIAGAGPLDGWLRRESALRPAGRIQLLGHVGASEDLARLYASCDVFVHPNPREPFGIGPLEAMAAGCPVVLPAAGGVLSYASPSNAWLADPSAEGFGAAIQALTRDAAARGARALRARATAEQNGRIEAAMRSFRLYDSFHDAFTRDRVTREVLAGPGGLAPEAGARPAN
jgi:glycosyltransferase involved in cell wall biosynthesis